MTATSPAPTAGADEPLLLTSDDDAGVRTITLNRPARRNALSRALMSALHAALDEAAAERAVRVLVLAAAGPAFCAGHDLAELREQGSHDFYVVLFDQCSKLMQRIVSCPKPVIARVHATATAAGCQLVASCDLAVAADTAKFATPGVNIGLFCSTPMVALSRNVARKHAMEMLLTGEPVTAARAAEMGLINRAVPADRLDEAVGALAGRIAGKSMRTLSMGKEAFYRQVEMPLAEAYDHAAAVMTRNMLAEDAIEGIDAFLANRAPDWRDR